MEYIVLCGQAVGGDGQPFEIQYNFDGERFDNRRAAISHGFKIRESDDFNIGVLERGKLVSLDWMDSPKKTGRARLAKIEQQIGL